MKAEETFSHMDESGAARMVDVGGKSATHRTARAAGSVTMDPATIRKLQEQALPKGDVLAVARVAGIMVAKQTHVLIPMCHPLAIEHIEIDFRVDEPGGRVEIEAAVSLSGKTGVEMEALTAVSVAALTIYDMCKAVDKSMTIGGIRLLEKCGGRSNV